jgi:tetratricopeptide (TPR) repeat protein
MQTVRSHIDDFFNSDDIKRRPLYQHCHFRVQTLTKAAKLLKSARRLDPNAVLVDEKDKDLKWTQDRLAWELLYWQSEAYYIEGQNAVAIHNLHFSELAAEGIVSTSTYKDAASKERTSYDNAIKAAERTLKYFPDNALSLIQLAKILHARGNRWRARGVMKRARKIHPDDMDVLKASQE